VRSSVSNQQTFSFLMISIKLVSIVFTAAICVAVAVPFSAGLVLRLGVTAGNWLREAELA
jgi:hypothetical protein